MSVSIKDVATKAGVSTATVSHVINQTRFVSEETKIKVRQAMKELKYRPNSVARSLRSRKSHIIGLLVPIIPSDTSNFFFMSIAQGIEHVLKEHGYNLILSNSNENLQTEIEQLEVFNSQLVDGLIMAPAADNHEQLSEVLGGEYPVVFIDRKPEGFEGDYILADGAHVTYEAVSLLLGKGHKKIGFITGKLDLTTSNERLEGYRKAYQEQGMEIASTWIQEGASSFECGFELAEKLLNEEQVTALLVANNIMSMGAFACLQQMGKKVPQEVAIIGFDDYRWTEITVPPLTMIRQPSFELGQTAAKRLLERINQPDMDVTEIRLKSELIIRGSC
ncbi:LacI family DNA-binding transcriptional regulator [Marinicrinis sediminis]|uniref:LacI family DNA-binding transcriptional regulator n=1 Tax=Marinicrinis sediminis TaxID=1652465 RepID=A0ABW5RDA0_9BACL